MSSPAPSSGAGSVLPLRGAATRPLLAAEQMLSFPSSPGRVLGRSSGLSEGFSQAPNQRDCDYPPWETLTHLRGPKTACSSYSQNHERKPNTAVG